MPLAAILGIGPCDVVSNNFWSLGGASAACAGGPPAGFGRLGAFSAFGISGAGSAAPPGISTSWRAPVLPSMMVIVFALAALAGLSAAGGAVSVVDASGATSRGVGACATGSDAPGRSRAAGPPTTRGVVAAYGVTVTTAVGSPP